MWSVRSSLVKGVSTSASSSAIDLTDCKNSENERVPRWLDVRVSFNCMTLVRERFANRRASVLQASRDVSAVATSGMTFSDTDENIALSSCPDNTSAGMQVKWRELQ